VRQVLCPSEQEGVPGTVQDSGLDSAELRVPGTWATAGPGQGPGPGNFNAASDSTGAGEAPGT
jgi:hypothetical protein